MMKIKTISLKLLSIIFISFIVVWFFVFAKTPTRGLEVYFFDIGQGDSTLIRTPFNQTMLIDGGPGNKVVQKLGERLPPLVRRIDIVLLTHPDSDHITGLVEVLRRYEVGAVVLSGADSKTDVYGEFLKTIKEKSITVIVLAKGEAIHFDQNLEFDILSPNSKTNSKTLGNDTNDMSIVGKLIFRDFGIMFTGDATYKVESKLLAYGENLKADILKVGHHGSKYSSSLSFLKLVSPKAAIIEVGLKNRYGHPSPAALSRLKIAGANIFRTDLNGDIKVLSDGFTTNIYKEK